MKLETMYQEIILDHYRNPHGRGLRDPFDAEVHHVNPTCGDEVTLRVHLDGSGPDAKVVDVSYDALGCSISQAATSVLNDLVVGHTVGESFEVLAAYQAMVQSRGQIEPDE
ncbi:MAG: nitrogen fixation protein NifU, partial [Actinomycetota bacterium]|nr:nitrogen fixation protein NifU [Actinomycetota bacterium]